jgi:hypothetical protein
MTSREDLETQIKNLNALATDIRSGKEETNRLMEPDVIRRLDDAMHSVQDALRELQSKLK